MSFPTTHLPDGTSAVTTRCVDCDTEKLLIVPTDGLRRRQAGEMIQRALPDLSPADRELLISGICSVCWEKFKPADEEDE